MIWEKIITFIKDRINEFSLRASAPEDKRRLVLICTCGFCVILTLIVIFQLIGNSDKKEERKNEQERLSNNTPISQDELFLPDEPDFLPGVLLDRERRETWTEEDIMEFWQDPLRAGEEQWRDKIDAAVNEILERVP